MEKHTEKIKKFSKVAYVLLQIALVLTIIATVFEAFAWLVEVEIIPGVFKIGGTTVYLPYFLTEGISINEMAFQFSLVELLRSIMSVVIVITAKTIFKKLRADGSPFHADIVKGLKILSILFLIAGVLTGTDGILIAGIVWLLCMVFDHGCTLQNERDTTL